MIPPARVRMGARGTSIVFIQRTPPLSWTYLPIQKGSTPAHTLSARGFLAPDTPCTRTFRRTVRLVPICRVTTYGVGAVIPWQIFWILLQFGLQSMSFGNKRVLAVVESGLVLPLDTRLENF